MSIEIELINLAVTSANEASEHNLELNHLLENNLLQIAFFLKVAIEYCALIILIIGIIKASFKLFLIRKKMNRHKIICSVRLELGTFLMLSLEFLLAADIAATAVSPSWDAIGKLTAISGIRTFLNFFLQKEVRELEMHE